VTTPELTRWCRAVDWQTVLNRAGTAFRKLADADKQALTEDKAIALMVAQPSMIKRPILEADGKLEIGFKPERYAALFGAP
jgi:arsenate reductase